MKVLINFANEKFKFNQKINSHTGKYIGGFDKTIQYSVDDIDQEFYYENRKILDQKRGAGLWLWKPYFIKKTLKLLNEGDILFYCDSGSFFIRKIEPLIKEMKTNNLNIFISFVPLRLTNWMRKEVFEKLNINNERYHNSLQPVAGFILLKNCKESREFIDEWLILCQNHELIRDSLPHEINYESFIEHRHDQSLLNYLTTKYNFPYYKDFTQFGIKPFAEIFQKHNNNLEDFQKTKGDYPIIILLYRTKNIFKFSLTFFIKLNLYKFSKSLYNKVIKN